jgi:lipopolysaccharide/colanic/teichoic acid biosynthesis glycosyltransferase
MTAKRAFDLVVGSVAFLLLLLPMVLIGLAVMLTSRGPVLFRQTRVGRHGQTFRIIKFRTMVMDAEAQHESLFASSTDPGWLKLDHDPRITRLGRFLRHTSLDELPQLWNVLRGQMSLVGPRPLIPSEHERIGGRHWTRDEAAPGITGLWQVTGRTDVPFDEMVRLDCQYVDSRSLWTDIRLIARSLPVVLRGSGAN